MNKKFEQNIVFEQIKEDLQQFKNENLLRCPNCDAIFEWDDADYNPAESEYTCPKCRTTTNEDEYETINMLDYIEEMYIAFKEKNDETDFNKYQKD